ncbi:MAG: histidine--tRNA ligase [Lachnospiraceae bacterium]|nr:histidine--tRNA ligase [Lachnospiraceae bacterium]
MPLVKKPVTGMKDIMPGEMQIREYVISMVRKTYASFGFSSIETPVVEHIENLCSKSGGENEKLIFKILKRGDKLDLSNASCEDDLVDCGLRYDLTLPLSRYYSNHMSELPSPFKALQIGSVFRAERPQKGRFRQFTQCDIDILGDPGFMCEVELILATTTLLGKIGFKGFTVRINDRRILKAMAEYAGFKDPETGKPLGDGDFEGIFITLDKMDKIGIDGVREELKKAGYSEDAISSYICLFEKISKDSDGVRLLNDMLNDSMHDACDSLTMIMDTVNATKSVDFKIEFDPTLVRGMSYYTGTIFEISMDEFGSSVAGGGRYDGMVEKFTGVKTPACGFSIGFERIITILLEKDYKVPGLSDKKVFLIEKGMDKDRLCEIIKEATELRDKGESVRVCQMNKNRKFQKEQLIKEGYREENIRDFYHTSFKN